MSLALVHSRAQVGVQAPAVSVETHLANGLPHLTLVGLPETAVKESKDRVRSAILNSALQYPSRRITLNLAPADLPKEGSHFDLPIALALLGAMGVTYLLLSTVFRGGARHDGGELLRVRLTRGGKTVTLRLLYDSGNLLTDPLTGESVPVIGQSALCALLPEREEGYITLSCTTAGGSGVLRAFYCDSVRVNGRDLGRRLVAVSPDIYGDSGFQGVWRMEEQEGAHELVQAALE